MASPPSPAPPSPPTIPPVPPLLPSPPGHPPSPPPIELLIADVFSWFWLSVLFAMIVISVGLRAASGRNLRVKPGAGGFRVRFRGALSRYAEQCVSSFPRSRDAAAGLLRAVAVGLLRTLAALFLVSAGLVFYGEARFSVMTSYSAPARVKVATSAIHSPPWPPGMLGFGPGLLPTFQRSASAAQAPVASHGAAVTVCQYVAEVTAFD